MVPPITLQTQVVSWCHLGLNVFPPNLLNSLALNLLTNCSLCLQVCVDAVNVKPLLWKTLIQTCELGKSESVLGPDIGPRLQRQPLSYPDKLESSKQRLSLQAETKNNRGRGGIQGWSQTKLLLVNFSLKGECQGKYILVTVSVENWIRHNREG